MNLLHIKINKINISKIILFVVLAAGFHLTYSQMESSSSTSDQLFSAGAISVTIGGNFPITGSFPALITERVDQFVSRFYNRAKTDALSRVKEYNAEVINKIEEEFDKYSFRNIILKRRSGEEIKIDLLKFRMTGDFSNNPYLKNDDVIIFAPTDVKRNFFTVSGAVNSPGKFNFVEGDKLSDAIELAEGVNKAYDNVDSVEINRLSYNGEKLIKEVINISSDYNLQRGDRIVVLADETQKKEFKTFVFGEVKRPGSIPITKNNTTIKEVIEAAGGFTDEASLKRAKLIRGTNVAFIIEKEFGIKLQDYNKYFQDYPNQIIAEYEKDKMLRMSTLTEEDTSFFFVDEYLRQTLNQATLNFDSVLIEDSRVGNLKVRDNDVLIIPQKLNTVYVFGQVASMGNIKFVPGKDYKFYIEQAGGLGELADDVSIAVIKSETREWIPVEDNTNIKIETGDFIYVPKNPNKSFNYYVGKVSNYLSIVGSVATVILLLYQFSSKSK